MDGLLIVDDQDVVRQGIGKMIAEFDLGIRSVFEASDGNEALKLANEHKPDIILVDVMMPGMDGLEFVNELKSRGSQAHIVIISAYSKFDFAQKAIALKVDNYILKPVMRNELYHVLAAILDKIQQDHEQKELLNEQQRKYDYLLLYEFLNSRNIFMNPKTLYNNTGIRRLSNPFFQLVLVQTGQRRGHDWAEVKGCFDRKLEDRNIASLSFDPTDNLIVYILNLKEQDGSVAADIGIHASSLADYVGASAVLQGEDSLPNLFRQAELALKECQFRVSSFCKYDDIQVYGTLLIDIGTYHKIVESIRNGLKQELTLLIDDILFKLSKSNYNFEDVRDSLSHLLYYVQLNLIESCADLKVSDNFKRTAAATTDLFGLKAAVKMEIERMYGFVSDMMVASGTSPVIRSVLAYISKNYNKDLSLALIANEHNINYNYLSTLFTKGVGIPFTDYLMKYRLDKAKELLAAGKYKVHEVADQVGFKDAKYFSKVFRKLYQTTPGEMMPKHSAGWGGKTENFTP